MQGGGLNGESGWHQRIYYFYVDFMDKHSNMNNLSDIPSTVAMIPAFYTSNTLLVKNCLDFSTYNCEDYGCTVYEKSPHTS